MSNKMKYILNDNRMNKAERHTKYMAEKYADEISWSITASNIYKRKADPFVIESSAGLSFNNVPKITVENIDSVGAVFKYISEDPVLLNFASYKYPGGGFMTGAMAQEEAICHESNLYNIIGSERFSDDYCRNRSNVNGNLYNNYAIFSPGVIFERSDSTVNTSVITCAAPNKKAYMKYVYEADSQFADGVMLDRIQFILDACSANYCKTLILGAFGCGVFGNDPYTVADMFKKELISCTYEFEHVIFAIPGGPNLDAFKSVFNI